MDYRNWPENEEMQRTGEKVTPRKSFVRRFLWQIIAIVSILLVVLLAYFNISMMLHPASITARSNAQPTPSQPTVAAVTPTTIPTVSTDGTDTPTATPSPTVAAQASLPCKVDLNSWTDGSSDWKILHGVLLNDASHAWDNHGPTIVAPCQLGDTANYVVEAQIQVISFSNYPCFGITLRGTPSSNGWQGYKAGVGDCNNDSNSHIARISGPDYFYDQQKRDATFDPTTVKHTYRVEARDATITFFVDGGQILTLPDNRYLAGAEVGLWSQDTQLQVFSFQVVAL